MFSSSAYAGFLSCQPKQFTYAQIRPLLSRALSLARLQIAPDKKLQNVHFSKCILASGTPA